MGAKKLESHGSRVRDRIALAFLLPLALSSLFQGCASRLVITGVAVHEEHWLATTNSLEPRARHELGCAQEQLQWSLYERRGKLPFDVGVEGCGRTRRYVGSYTRGWILRPAIPGVGPDERVVIAVNGVEVYSHLWIETLADVVPMAASALQCPDHQISVTIERKAGRYPIDVTAYGCGRSLMLGRRTVGNSMLGDWQIR